MSTCGKYLGDNDGTCPQLTCIREAGHNGLCDNVSADLDRADLRALCEATAKLSLKNICCPEFVKVIKAMPSFISVLDEIERISTASKDYRRASAEIIQQLTVKLDEAKASK